MNRTFLLIALVIGGSAEAQAQQRQPEPAIPRAGGGMTTIRIPANRESRNWCPQLVGVCTDSASGLRWHAAKNGLIPMDAVVMGEETVFSIRRTLHVCRAYVVGEVTPDPNYPGSLVGSIGTGDPGCRLAVEGEPVFYAAEYSVLVPTPAKPPQWLQGRTQLPADAARPAGHELDFAICKPFGPGAPSVVGAVLDTDTTGCVAVVDGEARAFKMYRILAKAR